MTRLADRFGPIRVRITLAGALVVGLALVGGAFAFYQVLESRLVQDLDQSIEVQAGDRASSIAAGSDPEAVVDTPRRETVIAVFAADDTLAASSGSPDPSPLAEVAVGSATDVTVTVEDSHGGDEVEIESEQLRAAAVAVADRDLRVVVASELDTVRKTLASTRPLLYVTVPALTALTALITWLLVGRALAPVERIRTDVDLIVGADRAGRVTPPGTGDEIDRLADTMNRMLDRLGAHGEAQRQFVSDASHELRSPVANIRARVETHPADADWQPVGADVIRETERLEAVIDDLTFLARHDEHRLPDKRGPVDLDEVLFAEAERLQTRGLVTVDAGGVEPLSVEANAGQLARLVRNLVDNAEHHARTTVRLACAATTAGVRLLVCDDGPGVSPEDRKRIFERFARVDGSRTRGGGGTGLGLAIVAEVTAAHDGTVTVSDAEAGGACFEVTLPSG